MRARDSRHRAEELAAVVRWLRGQADGWLEDAQALERLERPSLSALIERMSTEAKVMRWAADRLERGEHHGQG